MTINNFYIVGDNITYGLFIFFIIAVKLILIIYFDGVLDVGVGIRVGIAGGIPFVDDLLGGALYFFVTISIIYECLGCKINFIGGVPPIAAVCQCPVDTCSNRRFAIPLGAFA